MKRLYGLGLAAVVLLCAGPAMGAFTGIPLTAAELYGIDANSANTDGPFHAPIGVRITNTGGTAIPSVQIQLLNVSANAIGPCAVIHSTAGPSTTGTYSNVQIAGGGTYDYYWDLQFQRDSTCADKSNAHKTFDWQVTVNGGTPVVSETGVVIVGLAKQSNDDTAWTGCTAPNPSGGTPLPLTAVNGRILVTQNEEFSCTFTWNTSSNFDAIRVWQDWLGQFFEITSVTSGYTGTGPFNPPSPDCVLNNGCGSGGVHSNITQTVSVRAIGSTQGLGSPCPAPNALDSSCVTITSTVYDISAGGTHYHSQSAPIPVFDITTIPTAVRLRSFDVTHEGEDNVISWKTGYEVNNLGFRIYRDGVNGRESITPEVVAGSALFVGPRTKLTSGRTYSFIDRGASAGAQYWLEDIDVSGKTTISEPVVSQESFGAISSPGGIASTMGAKAPSPPGNSPTVSAAVGHGNSKPTPAGFSAVVQGKSPSGGGSTNSANQNRQLSLAGQAGMKVLVNEEGWYHVSHQDLVNAGWNPGSSPTNLQLYVEGQPIPMLVNDAGGGNYSMEFYGTGIDTPSTDTRIYWLALGTSAGSRLSNEVGSSGSASGPDFPFTVARKDRVVYVPGILNGDAESWFGFFIWPSSFGLGPTDESVTVRNLDTGNSGTASLVIAMQGAGPGPHSIDVTVNSNYAGTLTFSDLDYAVTSLSVPVGWLQEGLTPIGLTNNTDGDYPLVDYVTLTYPHLFRADSDALELTSPGSKNVSVAGFANAAIRVFDITNPNSVAAVNFSVGPDGLGGSKVSFTTPSAVGALRYLAVASDRIAGPSGLALNAASALNKKNNSADFVMISHPSFISSLAPLQALRQSQGLATQIVDVTDIYDEFSFGEKSPAAIRAFLNLASTTWKKAPKYVLLAGDGSLDPRGYLVPYGYSNSDFVPAKLVETFYLKTASDDWYVDFNDDSIPEMAIGRLPVETPAEAVTVVSKIVGYDSGSSTKHVFLAADKNDDEENNQNDFAGATANLVPLVTNGFTVAPPPQPPALPYLSVGLVGTSAARSAIVNAFNSGVSVINWVGHGESPSWSISDVFNVSDASDLTNSTHLPFVVSMDCLNGYFQDPTTESLAEALLLAPGGGASAVWSSSALTLFLDQVPANQTLFQKLFVAAPPRIGDATIAAKMATLEPDVRRTWILFGDPTMKLK